MSGRARTTGGILQAPVMMDIQVLTPSGFLRTYERTEEKSD